MRNKFDQQLKWFAQILLKIRTQEVNGFGLPIPFNLSFITNQEFDLTKMSKKRYLEDLVEEIRTYYVEEYHKVPGNRESIKTEYKGNLVRIIGINTKLLKSFLRNRLKDHASLFETKANNELFYIGQATGINLSGVEQTILTHLREADEKDLSYDQIFEYIANSKRSLSPEHETLYRRTNSSNENKKQRARDIVSSLLKKMKKVTHNENLNNDDIIRNIRNEGYELIM